MHGYLSWDTVQCTHDEISEQVKKLVNKYSKDINDQFKNKPGASFMHTSNPLQRISRTAIARFVQDLHDVKFKDAIQVYMCRRHALRILVCLYIFMTN